MSVIGNVGTYNWDSYAHTSSNREDLVDWIANVDPYDTPFSLSIGSTPAKSVNHQWQTDTLRARNTRGAIAEGANWALSTSGAPSRVNNYCELFGGDIAVTESQRNENPAGFGDTYAYEMEKEIKATMVDIESALMNDGTPASGDSGNGRVMTSLEEFITTTVYTAADFSTTTGDATHAGEFAASDVNAILNDAWVQGANIDLMVMGGVYKRQFSALTTSNTRNILATDKKVVVGVDVYDSDFGLVPIQLNRYSPVSANTGTATATATDVSGRIWFVQRSLVRIAWFRRLGHRLMGTMGDSTAGQIRAECTLEVGNEKGLAVMKGVNNITTSTP